MAPIPQPLTMLHDSGDSIKPIPAFYCCYLLRSTVRHASLYIGSTPDPSRRLAQHNGERNGGAKRTAREQLRPWEMVVVVNGFMNRVGALQFEWAWQNTQGSRHAKLEPCSRIYPLGKEVKSSGKPRTSLTNILENLHFLLRSSYFSKWPLQVHFLSGDVHGVWQVWSQRTDGSLDDVFEPEECDMAGKPLMCRAERLGVLDVGYDALKEYVEKSKFLLEAGEHIDCGVCKQELNLTHDLIAVCSHNLCSCASHLLCLSSHFLEARGFGGKLVPREGTCPACQNKLEWPTLMKEITLRLRGQEETERLFRRRRRVGERKGHSVNSVKLCSEEERRAKASGEAETGDFSSCGDRGGVPGSDNDSLKTIAPDIVPHSQPRPYAKSKRLGSYRSTMANDAEIIK
ncbi:hypothetical protein AJ78_06181 [Emergomyces pasteurianus Ep9510]|uniref:GIY-YIG domain-containing protein n=1 Tax=Emergomyces pasteurianus Ep9510 TaxID=1447872 RepID=A0A1J9P9X6_9EURO|nr:hypothetical protein AJ78_06181 [Emergomyces pasteurianus Ep9510]